MSPKLKPLISERLAYGKRGITVIQSHAHRNRIDQQSDSFIGLFHRGFAAGSCSTKNNIFFARIPVQQDRPGCHNQRVGGNSMDLRQFMKASSGFPTNDRPSFTLMTADRAFWVCLSIDDERSWSSESVQLIPPKCLRCTE